MRDCLSLRALQKAAHRTAELYGLKCPTREEMTRMYNSASHYQQPIITCCENGMMWVDRYYVAYQLGAGNVCYTYLTRYHIAEEYASCRQAAKERGKNVSLPPDIRKCFLEARRIMDENDMDLWVNNDLTDENS